MIRLLKKIHPKGTSFIIVDLILPCFEKISNLIIFSMPTEFRLKLTKSHKLFHISLLGIGIHLESYKR